MAACLTPAEYKDYLRYMKLDEPDEPIAPPKPFSVFDELEAGSLEAISEFNMDISQMRGLMEHFDDDHKIRDYCNYLIELYKIYIQEEYDNVQRWRQEKASA